MIHLITTYHNPGQDRAQRCCESVLRQDGDYFWHIYDDGSTDGSSEVFALAAKTLGPKRCRFARGEKRNAIHLKNQHDLINHGFDHGIISPTDHLMWLDGDDYLEGAEALAVVGKYFDDGKLVVFGGTRLTTPRNPPPAIRPYSYMQLHDRQPRKRKIVPAHFRGFEASLWPAIRKGANHYLKGRDKRWFRRCADLAVMFCAIEQAWTKVGFIAEHVHNYDTSNPLNFFKRLKRTGREPIRPKLAKMRPMEPVTLPDPWMDPRELACMERWIKPSFTMLEMGGGGSTPWLANRVRRLVTWESDDRFRSLIAAHKPDNVELVDKVPDVRGFDAILVDNYGPFRPPMLRRALNGSDPGTIVIVHDYHKRPALQLEADGFEMVDSVEDTLQTIAIFKT